MSHYIVHSLRPGSSFNASVNGKHMYIPDHFLRDKSGYVGIACYSSKDNEIDLYIPKNQLTNKNMIPVKFTTALKAKDKLGSFMPGSLDKIADQVMYEISLNHSDEGLKHAAPYSTPNTRKRLLARWTVKNLRVFQETPGNVNSGIFANFDLVNANNPKEKAYNMQFSFADGTSANKNIIARIRRFFNDAYNRQRGYGFPELTEMEKQQIVARINTAYNQWSGFSHSDTSDHIEHARSYFGPSNVSYTRRYGFGGEPNYGTLTVSRGRGETNLYDVTLDRKGARFGFVAKSSDSVDEIKQKLKSATNNDKILAPDEVNNTANLIKAVLNEAVRKYSSQHPGYYSPNLQHASDEPDIIDCTSEIKMSDFKKNGNYLEHFGILGMKWGVRRFQNPDGTLTNAGRKRYGVSNDPHKRVLAVVPAGTLPNSTRITGKEESDFWKAYAKQITDMQDALKNGDKEKYNKARNSFKSDEDKDKAERIAEKTNKPTRSYTPEQQKEKLEKAKKEDQYDLLFLEAIQNTRMFTTDGNKASIDKAYKEYLKDPDGFFTDPDFYKKYPIF